MNILPLTNPFKRQSSEPYDIRLIFTGSFMLTETKWHSSLSNLWGLDLAPDWPMRQRWNDKKEWIRNPGSVAIYAPGIAYEQLFEDKRRIDMAWFLFSESKRTSPLRSLVGNKRYCLFDDPACLVRSLIYQIFNLFSQPTSARAWLARSAFYQILGLLLESQCTNNLYRDIRLSTSNISSNRIPLQGKLENILNSDLPENITAKNAAKNLGMSLSSFTHRFQKETGETFVEAKTRLRIEKAKNLLLCEGKLIKEIAIDLGFSSPAHFSQTFHRVTGLSPIDFLKQVGSKIPKSNLMTTQPVEKIIKVSQTYK